MSRTKLATRAQSAVDLFLSFKNRIVLLHGGGARSCLC